MNEKLKLYLLKYFKLPLDIKQIKKEDFDFIAYHFKNEFDSYILEIKNIKILIVEVKNYKKVSIKDLQDYKQILQQNFKIIIVYVLLEISAINRQRMVDKNINFIVPDKQCYIFDLWVDLKEHFDKNLLKEESKNLLPSAQFFIIFYIQNILKDSPLEIFSFKKISEKVQYTQMAISKVMFNLKELKLIDISGTKEKFFNFLLDNKNLISVSYRNNLFKSPIYKKLYLNNLPPKELLAVSGSQACNFYLNQHSIDINAKKNYAIDKNVYYDLLKSGVINFEENLLTNEFCLELWKYNPLNLINKEEQGTILYVDKYSLLASLNIADIQYYSLCEYVLEH